MEVLVNTLLSSKRPGTRHKTLVAHQLEHYPGKLDLRIALFSLFVYPGGIEKSDRPLESK